MKKIEVKSNKKQSFHVSSNLSLNFSKIGEDFSKRFNSLINEMKGDQITFRDDFTFRNKSPKASDDDNHVRNVAEPKLNISGKVKIKNTPTSSIVEPSHSIKKIAIERSQEINAKCLNNTDNNNNNPTEIIITSRFREVATRNNPSYQVYLEDSDTIEEENPSLNLYINLNAKGIYYFKDVSNCLEEKSK